MIEKEHQIFLNLEAEMRRRRISQYEMAEVMGISVASYYNRRSAPGTLRLGELMKAAKLLKMDLKDLM